MITRTLFLAAAICAITLAANAAPLPLYGNFIYSTECWQEQSGDAGGNTLTLTRTPKGDKLIYGSGEDGPMTGRTAHDVLITSRGSVTRISFVVPPDPGYTDADRAAPDNIFARPRIFRGTISPTSVRLMMNGIGKYGAMPRRKPNYKPPMCR